MKQNVGTMDAYIRLTFGLTMLGMGTIYKSRSMVIVGAMETASGITRWCPLSSAMGVSTKEKKEDKKLDKSTDFPYPTPT